VGRDGCTGLAVLAASLALFWGTLGLERHPMVPVGPGFYPGIVLVVTALFAVGLVVADVVTHRRRHATEPTPSAAPANYRLVALAFGVFAAYVLALPWLGFRLSTFLFLVAMPPVFERPAGARAWALIVFLALVATAIVYFVFERYLHVLLPRGRWTGF
jgi:hypothetical protein